MSYMYLILAKDGDPNLGICLMDVPVEWRDGIFVPTGEVQDRPARADDIWQMLPADDEDHYPMQSVSIPNGWLMLANFWQPGRYVPSSDEVRKYGRKEAVQFMLERGLTTPEGAKKLLENDDV